MGVLKEKVAYLKGLTEGMELPKGKDEGKIIILILELLGDMASAVEAMEVIQDEFADDLGDLEDEVEELNEIICEEYEDYDDDYNSILTTCENCGVDIEFTPDEINEDGKIICPACKQEIDFCCDCEECKALEAEGSEVADTGEGMAKGKGRGRGKAK